MLRALCALACAGMLLAAGCVPRHTDTDTGPAPDAESGTAPDVGGTPELPHPIDEETAVIEPQYGAAAAELLAALKREHPGVEFRIEWNQQRLHLQMADVSIGGPDAQPEPQTMALFRSLIRTCLQTPSPPTEELWISANSDGGIGQERGQWEGYERAVGITTPHPADQPSE